MVGSEADPTMNIASCYGQLWRTSMDLRRKRSSKKSHRPGGGRIGKGRPNSFARTKRASTRLMASGTAIRSEEHTSELQSLMRNSYDVFCLQTKTITSHTTNIKTTKQHKT